MGRVMTNKNLIEGNTGLWEVVIGLEVHAQIATKAKLFSRSGTKFGAEPNTQVSFVDAGMPGMLPVINQECVNQAIKTSLGLNGTVNMHSCFDRKNYFYADLPTGYQITQHHRPIMTEGYLDIELNSDTADTKRIRLNRLHIEQDAGKSIHDLSPEKSYIDLNRAGIGLMEIVSEPDLRSASEAMSFVKKLRSMLRYMGTCDGDMEKGQLRADVNVSVHKPDTPLGTRAEVKNINSVRFIGMAIEHEIERQINLLEGGGEVNQETRLFDPNTGCTRSMRSKEDAHDYRYFPEPDLPPLLLTQERIDTLKNALPELPDAKKSRFMTDYQLSPYDAGVLVSEQETAAFYEEALEELKQKDAKSTKLLVNWLTGELFGALNRDGKTLDDMPVTARQLAQLVNLIVDDTISGKIAKDVFVKMWETGKDPEILVDELGLRQITDTSAIEVIIDEVVAANTDKVDEYKSGKEKLFGFFVGQVMKASQGKANPGTVNQLLKKKLS